MCPTNLLLVRHTCCLGKPIAEPSTRTIGSANARSHGLLWTLQSVCAPSLAVTSRQCRCWAPLVTRGGGCAITISPGSDILAKTAAFCSVLFMRWNPKLRSNLMHMRSTLRTWSMHSLIRLQERRTHARTGSRCFHHLLKHHSRLRSESLTK